MVIIPAYVNYWILVVIDFHKKAVLLYDPTMDFEWEDDVVSSLTKYLHIEA